LERPNMVKLIEKSNYFDYTTGNILTKGKAMKKRDLQFPPGLSNAHLLRCSFYGSKIKEFEFSTHVKKRKKNTTNCMTFRQ
jgi:hypothetical protein